MKKNTASLITVIIVLSLCLMSCSAARIERNLLNQLPNKDNIKSITLMYERDDTMKPIWMLEACMNEGITGIGGICIEGTGANLEEAIEDMKLTFEEVEKK